MGCDGYEDQFLASLTAIESSYADSKNLAPKSKDNSRDQCVSSTMMVAQATIESRGGNSSLFMKQKILSWNV